MARVVKANGCPIFGAGRRWTSQPPRVIKQRNIPMADLRALPNFDNLPKGHSTFWVSDDAGAPHLEIGEFAVIDTTDRKLQHGELYVMQGDTGRRKRSIVQAKIDRSGVQFVDDAGEPTNEVVWQTCQLRGFRKVGETDSGTPLFTGLSDCYPAEWLEDRLLGRVVGVSGGPLGNLLEPAAGYINEDAENAAFDEREYIEVMIGIGCEPHIYRGSNGKWIYCEKTYELRYDRYT